MRKIRPKQPDETKEITGPPKSVAYDATGKPTRAAESFAQKVGIPIGKLSIVTTPKGEYLAAKQVIRGKAGERNSGGDSPARGCGNLLAAQHVLDRCDRTSFHSPDSLGGSHARREVPRNDAG